jgi:hypothetical protein
MPSSLQALLLEVYIAAVDTTWTRIKSVETF